MAVVFGNYGDPSVVQLVRRVLNQIVSQEIPWCRRGIVDYNGTSRVELTGSVDATAVQSGGCPPTVPGTYLHSEMATTFSPTLLAKTLRLRELRGCPMCLAKDATRVQAANASITSGTGR